MKFFPVKVKYFYKYLAEVILLFMTIIWGGTFVVVKESLNNFSPTFFVALRFAIASIILLPLVLIKKEKWNKKVLLHGFLLGSFLFGGFVLQTIGLQFTTASRSGFITGTIVIIVPIFQTVIEKKLPTRGTIIGILFVLLGLIFLSSSGKSIFNFISNLGTNFNLGDVLTLLCAAVFALQVVYIDIFSPKHNFWVLLFIQLASVAVEGFLASLIFSFTNIEPLRFDFNFYILFAFFYTAVLATLVNIGLQTKFQKEVSPSKAGIIYSFEPVFAAVFAFFVLSEKITNFGLIGCTLIFTGLVLSEVLDSIKNKNGKRIKTSRNSG
ncbi:DMT family transporter [Melioribacteraceae bacterium 4301-Me]|uniref:DMT family transporter n=1 Tax=Pyranulibacter aquaticus TaxID=3163344 RepID=UPI0035991448